MGPAAVGAELKDGYYNQINFGRTQPVSRDDHRSNLKESGDEEEMAFNIS